MATMIAGLVLFLGLHLIPTAPRLRQPIVAKLGENGYKAAFSIGAALGLALIVAGYWMRPERVQLFDALPAARAAAPLLVTIAFVLFAAANMKTHTRQAVRHPMLLGLMLWSGVHLFANGDLAGTILFGAFFAYAIVDLVSVARRHTVKAFEPLWKHDAIAVTAGILLAFLTIRFHSALFGTGLVA